ncbi:ABC transporter ATP-binding protein [Rhodobium gokarnense]|uniref:NitT/TauT family transport system ATP-binding protein n=1 Tax=Rhodobium gokarnense TaxID=364296 RepID=A0ABT3H956_9HYPH|nr:ABC transporter ATP-binding protein [Rhodobium gokarnense]MCW2306826.1 NitT/TauT family transport system ATP-binding protein [Rhodobium gokarnense]
MSATAGPIREEMPAPAVCLQDVSMTYPSGHEALRDVSLTVAPGEFVSIIGPSGCGKTTILRIIAGLVRPTAGGVFLDLPQNPGAGNGNIGFVFQEPTLMPWADVFSNVWLPLRLRGLSKAAARPEIETMLERVGLADAAGAFPGELSGGMKMRVSIARALVTGPPLLLMDEPFAALDEITRFRLNDDLLSLWSDLGCTILFVTHSVYESVYLSDRIAVMGNAPGRICEEMTVDGKRPRNGDFRVSGDYLAACATASRLLRAATAGGG